MNQALGQLFAALPPGAGDLVGIWVAALLTLAVLSYALGSNPLFRLAEYLFVGVAAGYGGALAWTQVLWPRLLLLVAAPRAYWHYGLFFLLGFMLLARGSRRLAVLGNLPLGVLFGVGAALALGGALTGTLVPQLRASVVSLAPRDYPGAQGWLLALEAGLLLLGTLAALSAFHFSTRGRGMLSGVGYGALRSLGVVGRGLIMVVLGALIAGALLSFFAILNSRVAFLFNDWLRLFANTGW
jgi:hypothetical protein